MKTKKALSTGNVDRASFLAEALAKTETEVSDLGMYQAMIG